MESSINIVCIIQARLNSTRLPNKVLLNLAKKPAINHIFERLSRSERITKIVLATTKNKNDEKLADHINKLGYDVFRGSEKNVLGRYYECAKKFNANVVIRVTGDCPLIDPRLVDRMVQKFISSKADYLSDSIKHTYPDGINLEVFSFSALKKAFNGAKSNFDKEHVTPFIKNSSEIKKAYLPHEDDFSSYRWTLDEKEDYVVLNNIFEHFYPVNNFSWLEVVDLCKSKPEMFLLNKNIPRDEGSRIGTGQKLWHRAKQIIPGGNMLLSKRSEMFLPKYWPSYFSKSKECFVWDLDGRKFIDMSIMGIGTNILGYGNPFVDNAVLRTIKNGNMSTLNCPEEVYLAEELVSIHPWADMVKFTRSGGEANSVAVRIARAASGKDNIAICGYHGWHDWYLSANLSSNKELDGHLLPGLEPNGVPRSLQGTVFPFQYNNLDELINIIESNEIGIIKMEVSRNEGPKNNFLKKVREIANEKSIVLIFDECTSGFRESYGGLHKNFEVDPDIAIFGKALGNGYAINAVIGKREIMEAAQSSFISSTFWTERIGPTAAIETLKIMKRDNSWSYISQQGKKIKENWLRVAKSNNLDITISGLDALARFSFNSKHSNFYKTYITQEMLKKGYLASNMVYVCTEHSDEIIENYMNELNLIFEKISLYEKGNKDSVNLEGPEAQIGFKRVN